MDEAAVVPQQDGGNRTLLVVAIAAALLLLGRFALGGSSGGLRPNADGKFRLIVRGECVGTEQQIAAQRGASCAPGVLVWTWKAPAPPSPASVVEVDGVEGSTRAVEEVRAKLRAAGWSIREVWE